MVPPLYETPDEDKISVLKSVMVEGKYAPSMDELGDKLAGLELANTFSGTAISSKEPFVLSFETSEHSHLFTLCVQHAGYKKNLFHNSPPEEFFSGSLMDDYRVDGYAISFNEKMENNRSSLLVIFKQGSPDMRENLSNLLKNVICEVAPNLKDEVTGITF